MSLQLPLSGVVHNDLAYDFQLTYNRILLNLTGYTVRVVLKPSATAADASGITYEAGTGLTITSAAEGEFTWDIPAADVPAAGAMWYRADVIDGLAHVATALYGPLTLIAA